MSFSALGRGVEDIHCEVAGAGADVRCCVVYMVLIACTVRIEEFESMQTCAVTSDTGNNTYIPPPLTLMIILHYWVFPLTLMSNLKMA